MTAEDGDRRLSECKVPMPRILAPLNQAPRLITEESRQTFVRWQSPAEKKPLLPANDEN